MVLSGQIPVFPSINRRSPLGLLSPSWYLEKKNVSILLLFRYVVI